MLVSTCPSCTSCNIITPDRIGRNVQVSEKNVEAASTSSNDRYVKGINVCLFLAT